MDSDGRGGGGFQRNWWKGNCYQNILLKHIFLIKKENNIYKLSWPITLYQSSH